MTKLKKDLKIYIAGSVAPEFRTSVNELTNRLRENGYDVYAPLEHTVENAWDWPNNEWGLQIFRMDVEAINQCDIMVVLSWGRRMTTAGTSWEQGYAYGIGKKILFVEMNNEEQSLMCANGRYATVKGIDNAVSYPFYDMQTQTSQFRTNTPQT
jgi:nucleoside 2-deoxyribosyltransferase